MLRYCMIIDFFRSLLYKSANEKTFKEVLNETAAKYPLQQKWIKIALYTLICLSITYLSLAPIRLLLKNQYLPTFFMHQVALITHSTIIMLVLNVFIDIALYHLAAYIYTNTSWILTGKYLIVCIRSHLYSALSCLAFLAISFLLTL